MMCGGFNDRDIEDSHRNLIHHHKADIEAKLGATHSAWTINRVQSQVVAGTYTHFHLTGDNGTQISVLVFEPLPHTNAPSEVVIVEQGHTDARNPN